MTEDEAKTKFCPLTMMLPREAVNQQKDWACMGSGCMMWRAERETYPQTLARATGSPLPSPSGYCALAGKP